MFNTEKSKLIKKLLQYNANKDIKDKKGRKPLDLAIEKNKNMIVELIKDSDSSCCQLSVFRPGIKKVHKSYLNVILFILLHITFQISTLLLVLPCKI